MADFKLKLCLKHILNLLQLCFFRCKFNNPDLHSKYFFLHLHRVTCGHWDTNCHGKLRLLYDRRVRSEESVSWSSKPTPSLLCSRKPTNGLFFIPMDRQPLGGLGRLIFRGFTITLYRHITLGRIPLDEGPARSRDLYLTTHNTHKRQTSMPPMGFEPTILVSERPQTHALDRTATGIGSPMGCILTKDLPKNIIILFNVCSVVTSI
jgi:hypothetical protein